MQSFQNVLNAMKPISGWLIAFHQAEASLTVGCWPSQRAAEDWLRFHTARFQNVFLSIELVELGVIGNSISFVYPDTNWRHQVMTLNRPDFDYSPANYDWESIAEENNVIFVRNS